MKTSRPHYSHLLAVALLLSSLGLPNLVFAQSGDDFDDGNDDGWTRYNPLQPGNPSGNVAPLEFSFPNGGYRMRTTNATGNPDNPGRGGSVRQGQTYTNFYVTVDVVDWKDDTRQAFGLLARISNPGLFTTRGYAFTYERGSGVTMTSGDTDLSRIDCVTIPAGTFCEVPFGIGTGPSAYHLDPAKDYRFVFIGKGANLEGRIYELPNISTPVLSISGVDATFESGQVGLVVYDNSNGNGVVDATFDNYFAQDEESPKLFIDRGPFEGDIIVGWPVDTPDTFVLQSTDNLSPSTTWTDITSGIRLSGDGTRKEYDDNFMSSGPIKFYRLKRP